MVVLNTILLFPLLLLFVGWKFGIEDDDIFGIVDYYNNRMFSLCESYAILIGNSRCVCIRNHCNQRNHRTSTMYIQFHIHKGDYTHVTARVVGNEDITEIELKWDVSTYYDIFNNDVWSIEGIADFADIINKRPTSSMTRVSSEVAMRPSKVIVCELQLYSTYLFKSKTSTPVYLARPIDHSLPTFYVHSNLKKKYTSNVWISIDYVSWSGADKFPTGSTKECFGSIHEFGATENALFQHYQLVRKSFKIPMTPAQLQQSTFAKKVTHDPFKRPIISIDPVGCRDIDDAFSYEHNEKSGETKLWIHISDVIHNTRWLHMIPADANNDVTFLNPTPNLAPVTLESLADNLPRSTSVYLKKSIVPMLPNEWSSGSASLIQGESRYMITLEITIRAEGTVEYQFIPTRGKITKNESYDSYVMTEELQRTVSRLYQDTVARYTNGNTEDIREFRVIDTHTLVEAMMIIYNVHFGNRVKQSIIRTQRPSRESSRESSPLPDKTLDTSLLNYLRIIKMEKANYLWVGDQCGDSTSHHSLGLLRYTHASSPIRRMVDLMNQYIYFYGLSIDIPTLKICINNINQYEKTLRGFYRKLNVLFLADRACDPYKPLERCAYIVSCNTEKNRMSLYIPSESVTIRVPIVHRELVDTVRLVVTESHIEIYPVTSCVTVERDAPAEPTHRLPLNREILTRFYGKPNLFAIDDSLKFTMEVSKPESI